MKVIYALAAAVLLASSANAAFKTGNDLLALCNSSQFQDKAECIGYVVGVADSIEGPLRYSTKLKNGKVVYHIRACIRDGVTAGQLRDTALKWMQDNPNLRDMSADGIVAVALGQAFPC